MCSEVTSNKKYTHLDRKGADDLTENDFVAALFTRVWTCRTVYVDVNHYYIY